VFIVHGTRKFLDRMPGDMPPTQAPLASTTMLGDWYAAVLFWRPQVALFVNEPTRLPLFVAFAPATTVIDRMRRAAADVFTALGLAEGFIAQELAEMSDYQLAKTASRSVLGTMNDFGYLADAHRAPGTALDLLALSLQLAQTPCGPLYRSHISPDREIVAYIAEHDGARRLSRGSPPAS
jgi:hypothetical protein